MCSVGVLKGGVKGLSLPASCSGCPHLSGVPWWVMVG